MAAAVFTLSKVTEGKIGRGDIVIFSLAVDTGDYTTGGIAPTPTFASFNRYRREPSLVLFDSNDGYVYGYDYTNKLILVRAQTNAAAEDAALGELTTATACAAGVGAGVRCIAIWMADVP